MTRTTRGTFGSASHTRAMLTLSLAAMAGFVTVFAAILRTANLQAPIWTQVGVEALGLPAMRFEIRVAAIIH